MKQRYLIILTAFVCLLSVLSSDVLGKMSKDDVYLLFTQANQDFSKANEISDNDLGAAKDLYDKAILGYEKIIESGQIHNSKLYYNLANSYLLTDDIGRAILNYRRAQRLDSSNPDIHKNLNFARSKRVDQLAVTAKKKVMERLFFWHYDFSTHVRFVIGGICFTVFCVWLTLKLWLVKWPAVVPVCFITLLVAICMTGSIAVEQVAMSKYRSGVIIAEFVIARQGDGINYPGSFNEPLNAGIEFDLIEQRPGWLHISLPNGQDTWVPENSVELI